jgi:UDP-N-acetylmuramoylalanine--D-glutamate ligase
LKLEEKKFLVFGTGISGISAAELLTDHGISVVLYDGNDKLTESEIRAKSEKLKSVDIVLGDLPEELMHRIDVAVLSPGVPVDLLTVENMRRQGVDIWGEIELAWIFEKGRVLAITGTNGKTTTTSLLGAIMERAVPKTQIVGNIGIPYTSVVGRTEPDSVTVAEISSFQLETIHTFCPEVTAILNITPDHLNRHHTMENYTKAKLRITENQGKDQVCVLNYEDPILQEFAGQIAAKLVFFSSQSQLDEGIYLDGENIVWAFGGQREHVCSVKDLNLIGRHNYENVMAAVAMALVSGAPMNIIREALISFTAVAHRIEYVVTKRGVRFYNDSKGTNPDAAIQAVRAMEWPTLLIGGGYDKNSEYGEWIDAFEGKVKKLVLLGATRQKIKDTAIQHGYPKEDIILVESLQDAVKVCYENAQEGDAVLLSPACASWGMFQNYEQRGEMFKEMARALQES